MDQLSEVSVMSFLIARSSGLSVLAGDIIGCGLDFTTNRAFFTKNGKLIGKVYLVQTRKIILFLSLVRPSI